VLQRTVARCYSGLLRGATADCCAVLQRTVARCYSGLLRVLHHSIVLHFSFVVYIGLCMIELRCKAGGSYSVLQTLVQVHLALSGSCVLLHSVALISLSSVTYVKIVAI